MANATVSGTHAGVPATTFPALRYWAPALTLGATLLAWVGHPAPIVATIFFLVTARLATRYGWLLAWALTLVSGAVGLVCLLRMSVIASPDIGLLMATIWTATAIPLGIAEFFRPSPSVNSRSMRSLAIASLVPVSLGALFLVRYLSSGRSWIGWSMSNDVAWRTRMVRWILQDGGTRTEHSSPDPLTTVLNATWSGMGYDPAAPGPSLGHIIAQSAQVTVLVWLAVSLTVAAMTLTALRGRPLGVQIACSATAALLPWTWFMTGYSIEYGFQNAGPSVLLLIAAWIMWEAVPRHAVVSSAGLILVTVALVMTWAPLGVVGAAFLAAVLAHHHAKIRQATLSGWLLMAICAGIAVTYALGVTLVSLRQSPLSALANEGAMLTFHPIRTAIVVAAAVVVGGLSAAQTPARRHAWLGAAWALAGVAASCAALLHARRNADTLWGYYPIKFVWLVVCAAILIAATTALAPLGRWASSRWRGNGTVLVAALAISTMVMVSPKPPTTSGPASPLNIVATDVNDAPAKAVVALFGLHQPSFVSGYSRGVNATHEDSFISHWLLQIDARTANDPIRGQAYVAQPDSPEWVCAALKIWAPVKPVVWTSRPARVKQVKHLCGSKRIAVDIRLAPRPSN